MPRSYDPERRLVTCAQCPRLVEWRERVGVERRRAFRNWTYWAKPVPNFGDPLADRLIVGLAPAAHGANRTGRMFTGDDSGAWLYRALYKAGVANRPDAIDSSDGLVLRGALITAVIHCAPPDNKPTREEIGRCRPYLQAVLASREWQAILCLGGIAWSEVTGLLQLRPRPAFRHRAVHRAPSGTWLVGSYHPSRQNTFTKRLTEEMLDEAVNVWLTAGEA